MGKSPVKDRKIILLWGESGENLMRPWVQFWCPLFKKDNNTLESVGGKKRRNVKIFFKNMFCNERI